MENIFDFILNNIWWIIIALIFLSGFSKTKKRSQQQQEEAEKKKAATATAWEEWDNDEEDDDWETAEHPYQRTPATQREEQPARRERPTPAASESDKPFRRSPSTGETDLDTLPIPQFLKDVLNEATTEEKPFRQPYVEEGSPSRKRPVTPSAVDSNRLRGVGQELSAPKPTTRPVEPSTTPVLPSILTIEEEYGAMMGEAVNDLTRRKMAEAIIMAEIIGKPKALQNRH